MKRILLLLIPALMLMSSCQDRRFQTYMANVPVYMSYEELRSAVKVEEGRDLREPGKIYFMDQYMYINEYREGIHVVDLSDPSAPVQKAFIAIPGNVDMAIRNNILYADSFTDLVLIDISDPVQPSEVTRVKDLFEYLIPPYDADYPLDEIDQEKGVILDFELREITREVYTHPTPWPIYYDYAALESSSVRYNASAGGSGNTYGTGGSMARFITYDDYLYALESTYKLKTIDLSDPARPAVKNEQYLWGNIETLFISGAYMYVGSSNGMHILSLEEPSVPILLSTYQHITSCDPVVVDGNMAYVTLRAGNTCGGNQNLLEVIDISNRNDPERMVSYAMTEPYGLGIDGNTLFVCEGTHGLKVYDAADPYAITSHQIAQFDNIHAHDVIPLASFLFMIGEDGFYIYDYSDLNNITLSGQIPVVSGEEAGD